jgi:hypothetical protein
MESQAQPEFKSFTLIPLFIRRLARQLPHVTGQSADEASQDDLWIAGKEFLVKTAGRGLFGESLEGFMDVIEKLIEVWEFFFFFWVGGYPPGTLDLLPIARFESSISQRAR